MALDERLSKTIAETIAAEVKKEITLLNRKLKRALIQRDQWKYKAEHYRNKLLERGNEQT
jgi:hypothetical protein